MFALAAAPPEQGCIRLVLPAAPGRCVRNDARSLRPETVGLTLVDMRESESPADRSPPVQRRLPTSYPVDTPAQAMTILGSCRRRRIIEQALRTLEKAGFDIEAADIASPAVME